MNLSPTNNIPWDLISSSFSGDLTQVEEFELQKWIASGTENKKIYEQLNDIWNNGTEDYKLYLLANEDKAWNTLYTKIISGEDKKIKRLDTHKKLPLYYQIAAASVIFILFGVGLWYYALRNNTTTYETASNEKRNVELIDGTSITLNPDTKIKVAQDYNTKNRTVSMTSGEALFSINHKDDLPFIVNLGDIYVQDIGTVFNIKRDENFLKINVISGIVTVNKISTEETRKLYAGTSIIFDNINDNFNEIKVDSPAIKVNVAPLNFDNTPLIDVIKVIQKKFDKNIQIETDSISKRRLTAKLEDVPFENILEIICRTLNLEYTLKDNIYILHEKKDNQNKKR